MSGALSLIGNIASVVGSFFGGAAVQLGPFTFYSFEVPERMRWGGEHAGTLHKLIGGARVLDKTGPDDAPIEWSGVLLGLDAKDRARQLNALREDGGPFDLDWAGSSQRVWFRGCRFDEGHAHISYQITCEVIPQDDGADNGDDQDFAPAGNVPDWLRLDGARNSIGAAFADVQRVSPALLGAVSTTSAAVSASSVIGAALLGTAANTSAMAAFNLARSSVETGRDMASGAISATTNTSLGSASGFLSVMSSAGDAARLAGGAARIARAAAYLGG